MKLDLDKCPECGYVNSNHPDVCPSCGCNLQEYREKAIELQRIKDKEKEIKDKENAIERKYKKALKLFTADDFLNARIIFLELNDYKDSASYPEKCIEEQYKVAVKTFESVAVLCDFFKLEKQDYDNFKSLMLNFNIKDVRDEIDIIINNFKNINDYKDSDKYLKHCEVFKSFLESLEIEPILLEKYNNAYKLFETKKYEDATKTLTDLTKEKKIPFITQKAKDLLRKIKEIKKSEEEAAKVKAENERLAREAEKAAKIKAEKKKKIIKIAVSLGIILAIIIVIIIGISSWKSKEESKYGASNITISVVSKTNGSQSFNSYTTNLKITVTNDCSEKITYLKGSMIIFGDDNKELWRGDVSLNGDVDSGYAETWNLELKSDNSDLWNYVLTEMKIQFKISSANFDGFSSKSYSEDYKTIYPKS